MNDKYTSIRAYRVEWLQQISDWWTILPVLQYNRLKTTKGITLEYLGNRQQIEQDIQHGAVFMTNHRDIVLDAAYLSMKLRLRYNIRPYMGIGNNLFGRWWIEFLVRFNRCFVVVRNGTPKELMEHSKAMSSYINMLRSKGKSIWIAQREGRSKDGNDKTQPAVLKMLLLDSDKTLIEAIKDLNICPVSLSYQHDPCDYLKALEAMCKRDNPAWKKTKEDDVLSMKTGITGQKGQVVFRMTPSINHWLEANEQALRSLSRNALLEAVAAQIDQQIYQGYQIWPPEPDYLEQQVAKAKAYCNERQMPFDETFIRDYIATFYKNIENNHKLCNKTI